MSSKYPVIFRPIQQRLFHSYSFLERRRIRISCWFILLVVSISCFGQGEDGPKKYYFPNGQVSSEGTLVDGKPEGWWRTYYENGTLRSEGNRVRFQLDSIWRFYDEEGVLASEISYKADKKNGPLR